MSTRQKSFFEQDHSNKKRSRPPWNRPSNANNAPATTAAVPTNIMPKPPIAPSSQAKSKLKAFQFIEGAPTHHEVAEDPEKENQPMNVKNRRDSADSDATVGAEKEHQDNEVTEEPKEAAPSTPATRLPLADLIGHIEDATRRRPAPIPSPEEHVVWEHAITPGTSRPKPSRGKKRARSSSPVSSSQNEASNFFGGEKESFDLQNLQQSLKTPKNNPAAELWSRYTQGLSSKNTPATNKAVAFAHLIDSSSPVTPGSAGSVGGLRRWASCGVEWPASRTKRRKTNAATAMEQVEQAVANADTDAGVSRPRQSKVGFLVDRIQETLGKPPPFEITAKVSSSSPLPETGGFQKPSTASPVQRLPPVEEEKVPVPQASSISRGAVDDETPTKQPAIGRSSSSEYGEDDLDLAMIDAVETEERINTRHEELSREDVVARAPTGLIATGNPLTNNPVQPAVLMQADDDDEFEDDGDLLAADLEQVASLYDTRPDVTQNPTSPQEKPTEIQGVIHAPVAPKPKAVIDFTGSSDDEFECDDLDMEQLEVVEAAATQAYQASDHPRGSSEQERRVIQRYLVKSIVDGSYSDERGRMQDEKVLLVEDEKSKLSKAITLRQAWVDTPCTTGSYVHVIGEFSHDGQCFIDNHSNMLILHPDHLISATAIADSFGCLRRAVLQDRIKATSDASKPQLYGNILHELFQEALKANRWDNEWLSALIHKIIPKHYDTLVELNLDVPAAYDDLMAKMPQLQAWAEIFVQASPANDAFVKDRGGKKVTMAVNKLLDVEEHVWSPTYGLKGNIDATVQVEMQDEAGKRTLTVPFEVKTGRNVNQSHRAQTALYTLLLSDRYDVDVAYGILYYMETADTTRIPGLRQELMHMIMQRNELARFVRDRLTLPPVLKESHLCNRCYAQTSCFLYNKLVEDGDGASVGPKEQYQKLVKSLKPSDQEFFKKWDLLLTKEESEMMRFRRELWTMLSKDREKLGRCFANVIIEPGSATEQAEGGKINRFTYTFVKKKRAPGFSFTESQIAVAEPIVISDEAGHFALANGYVTNVRRQRISVAVDRRLHNARKRQTDFDDDINQAFSGIMDVSKPSDHPRYETSEEPPVLYRLDKDEFSNGLATVRNNLLQIMDDNVFKARDLRSLIIDRRSPSFRDVPSANLVLKTASTPTVMNSDQVSAIQKVMAAENYALVLGMPGTGKTTTIAHIIRALVAKGKSILLTSYTHTAVDNILLKVRQDNIGILRIGATAKVHAEVQEFATLAARPKDTLQQVMDSWTQPPVVATTCLGINHPIFNQRTFDYCIVDEASQITLPVCLGPIRMAKKFVLVGDHYQLPPLVQNKEALEGGLDVSLFRLLSEQCPEAVVNLEHQYRMCADIMLLSNRLIYSGRLKCGTPAVASRALDIPNMAGLAQHHYGSVDSGLRQRPSGQVSLSACRGGVDCWLARALKPANKVHLINTDSLRPMSMETLQGAGNRILNLLEATLTAQLVESLLSTGIKESSIGIITFYRSQLALLRQHLRHRPSVEMHTADKFQGRDKEVVIVSLVRSNDTGNVGELLKDWRRVNVAVTRAKSKLIMVGSKKTIERGGEVLKGLVDICLQNGWLHDLPTDAADSHWFEDFGTQISDATPGRTSLASPTKSAQGSPTMKEKASPRKILGRSSGNAGRKNPLQTSPKRKVLGDGSGNAAPVKKEVKKAAKIGRMGEKALLNRRPVLQDILNEYA